MEGTSGDVVWAITNIQMGRVANPRSLPVFEQSFRIDLVVNVLRLDPTKDNLLKKLRSEDVISVELTSAMLEGYWHQ